VGISGGWKDIVTLLYRASIQRRREALKWFRTIVRAMLPILFIATLLWGAVFFLSLQDYNEYVKDYYERCEQKRREALERGYYVDFWGAKPYRDWNNGGSILLFGFALLCVWIMIFLKRKSWVV
jgi:hypothetical protein